MSCPPNILTLLCWFFPLPSQDWASGGSARWGFRLFGAHSKGEHKPSSKAPSDAQSDIPAHWAEALTSNGGAARNPASNSQQQAAELGPQSDPSFLKTEGTAVLQAAPGDGSDAALQSPGTGNNTGELPCLKKPYLNVEDRLMSTACSDAGGASGSPKHATAFKHKHSSISEPDPLDTVQKHLQRSCMPADGPGTGRVLLYQGLRVRIGIHSGAMLWWLHGMHVLHPGSGVASSAAWC